MNSLSYLRRYFRYLNCQYFTQIKPLLYKSGINFVRNFSIPSITLCSSVFSQKLTPAPSKTKTVEIRKLPPNFQKQIQGDCISSELKINNLILTLESAITDTCQKYRILLKKQVEILDSGINKDPLDAYWDRLVPLRVESNNLKKDFDSYRSMVEYVGQFAFNLAFCSALISNLDSKDYVCNEYFKLEKIAKEQVAENKVLEEILLKKNIQNILVTPKSSKDLKKIAAEIQTNVEHINDEQNNLARQKILNSKK